MRKLYDDPYLEWLSIDATANYLEGRAGLDQGSLQATQSLFSEGYKIAISIPRLRADASEWPALSRAPVGTFFNYLNVQVKKGLSYRQFDAKLKLMNAGMTAFGEHVHRKEKIMTKNMGNMYVSELFINLHLVNARMSHRRRFNIAEDDLKEIKAIVVENGGLDQLPLSRQNKLRGLRREAFTILTDRRYFFNNAGD